MFGMWYSKLWTCCPESNHEKLFAFFYSFKLIIFFQNINPDTYSTPPPHTHTHIHIDFWQAPSHFHAFISELNSGLTHLLNLFVAFVVGLSHLQFVFLNLRDRWCLVCVTLLRHNVKFASPSWRASRTQTCLILILNIIFASVD